MRSSAVPFVCQWPCANMMRSGPVRVALLLPRMTWDDVLFWDELLEIVRRTLGARYGHVFSDF